MTECRLEKGKFENFARVKFRLSWLTGLFLVFKLTVCGLRRSGIDGNRWRLHGKAYGCVRERQESKIIGVNHSANRKHIRNWERDLWGNRNWWNYGTFLLYWNIPGNGLIFGTNQGMVMWDAIWSVLARKEVLYFTVPIGVKGLHVGPTEYKKNIQLEWNIIIIGS